MLLVYRKLLELHANPSICTVQYVTNCMHSLTDKDYDRIMKYEKDLREI